MRHARRRPCFRWSGGGAQRSSLRWTAQSRQHGALFHIFFFGGKQRVAGHSSPNIDFLRSCCCRLSSPFSTHSSPLTSGSDPFSTHVGAVPWSIIRSLVFP